MNPQPKSKWYWRLLRWGLIAIVALATLIAALITEENWRSKHAWLAYKQAAETRGARFDWSIVTPTEVPDRENLAKAPVFSWLSGTTWDDQALKWQKPAPSAMDRSRMSVYRSDGSVPPGEDGAWQQARLTRLEDWQAYYRQGATNAAPEFPVPAQSQSPAADVLFALDQYGPAIEELRTAVDQRPYFRRGGYSAGDHEFSLLMTWLSRFKGISQVLRLRAVAELENHQSPQALQDVELALRLDDKLRQDPLLISHLVGMAMTTVSLQPVYEGLARHDWTDAQLGELEAALAAKNFPADFQYAMQGELVFAVDVLETERITGEYKIYEDRGDKTGVTTVSFHHTPGALFYQNELAAARLNMEILRPLVDVTNRVMAPALAARAENLVNAQARRYSPYRVLALSSAPALFACVRVFAAAQAAVDLARVGCALERYRLAHGDYPPSLDLLAPQFIDRLPHDVINGQPLHYRRTDDGKFILYSIGWNGQDDGGTITLTKSGTVDRKTGDWVWRY